jgi:phosphopantothenoylcysteine synthetase/decarboxylase
MNILVTAGNTQVPIDQVRCITNIFTGRTGAGIALHAHGRGHAVTLLTSHKEVVDTLRTSAQSLEKNWRAFDYRTFDDLHGLLEQHIRRGNYDVVIHCAAVSDYRSGGIFAPAAGTTFAPDERTWQGRGESPPTLVDVSAGKVKSNAEELWLRLTRTPKLVDLFRAAWGFGGILVKFKLEVGLDEAALLQVAEASRQQSQADLMVANTLEGARAWALLGPVGGRYQRLERTELPARLLEAVMTLHEERSHG